MRLLLKFLARLYPAAWRKRYGAEFEALIEDARPGLRGALDILKGAFSMQLTSWTPLRVLALSAVAGVVIAIGIAFAMPPKWSSAAVILAEGQTPERVFDVVNTAMSRSALTRIIRSNDIYGNNLKNQPVEDVLEIFKRDIQVNALPSDKGTAFQVRFVYGDPRVAQHVTMALASSVIESNLRKAIEGSNSINAEPGVFRLVEVANLPDRPINSPFQNKFAATGLAGGLLLGGPIAFILYRRRRGPPQ